MRKSAIGRVLFGIGISMMLFASFGLLSLDVVIGLNQTAMAGLCLMCFFGGAVVLDQASLFNGSQ